MPVVTINRAAGYDYAPLGRKLAYGPNDVTEAELELLRRNQQIVLQAAHGVLDLPEIQAQTEVIGDIEPPAKPKQRKRKGK